MGADAELGDASDAAARIGRAWRELRRGPSTAILTEHLFGRPGEPDSVEPGHLDILDLLAVRDERRMSDLATALRVDPSTVTRTLQRMEAAGLAQRAPAAADGRVVTVQLTDRGRQLHATVAARRTALMIGILESFAPEERDQLVGLVERFVDSLEAYVANGDLGRAEASR
jgi:DNA-binding MarR family transcriptional regulator